MSIKFPGRDRMPELRQSHLSSYSSLASDYAYPYVVSTPSDAADGPKAETKAVNTMESGNDHIPTAQPWPESKPSTKEEEREDKDIDVQLKLVLETFRDLLGESEDLFKTTFLNIQLDHFLEKEKNEEEADPKREAFLAMGRKKISRIIKQNKLNQTTAGMLQRSLGLDSPLSPLGRFKFKPPVLGGGGPLDINGSTSSTSSTKDR